MKDKSSEDVSNEGISKRVREAALENTDTEARDDAKRLIDDIIATTTNLFEIREVVKSKMLLEELALLPPTTSTILLEYFGEQANLPKNVVFSLISEAREYRKNYEAQEKEQRLQKAKDANNKTPKAKYPDFVNLIEKEFQPRRCLIRGDAMTFDTIENDWIPVANRLDHLKSIAMDSEFYASTKVESHFYRYQAKMEKQLLIDIPEWDKFSRLQEFARCLECKNYDGPEVYEILADWSVKAYKRVFDETVRNRILILRSEKQNIGKDWLISAMCGGWAAGGYLLDLNLSSKEEEIERKLHKGIIFSIPEFDRSRQHVATLKNIITAQFTDARLPYDKSDQKRKCRGSFISSTNSLDILGDHENTRYIILDIKNIHWDYPGHDKDPNKLQHRLQVIAEVKNLVERGFTIGASTERTIKADIHERSPESMQKVLEEWFDRKVSEYCGNDTARCARYWASGWIPNSEIENILMDAKKMFGWSVSETQKRLGVAGRRKRKSDGTWYKFNKIEASTGNLEDFEDEQ